jgi:hypothetical protein
VSAASGCCWWIGAKQAQGEARIVADQVAEQIARCSIYQSSIGNIAAQVMGALRGQGAAGAYKSSSVVAFWCCFA